MIKKWVDEISGREIITFYYPIEDIISQMSQETSYKMRSLADVNQAIPPSLVFNPKGDKPWVDKEIPKTLSTMLAVFDRPSYGITPDNAFFYSKDIDGKISVGLSVNDYKRQTDQFLQSLDAVIYSVIIYSLVFRWYIERGQMDTAKYYQAETMAYTVQMRKAFDLLKRQRTQLVYPAPDSDDFPENYDLSNLFI